MQLPQISPVARQRALSGHGVSLLVWHDFVPTERDKLVWFDTPLALFDKQLARLKHAGAKPISLEVLYRYLTSGSPTPPRGAILVCFDDNTVGIREHAVPRMAQRSWPFAVSAHTAYIGVRTSKLHNDFDALRDMERNARATIVSQTHTHPPDLRTLSDTALKREMDESRQRLENELGHAINWLTYPSGHWNERVARAALDAGYTMALTEDNGYAETSPNLLGIHRFSTHRRFEEALAAITRSAG